MGEHVLSKPMERIALINETFQICVQTIDDKENITDAYDFLGTITDVQVELDAGQHGWMYITGASESIELERGKFLRTHSDKTLKDIVNRVIEDKLYVLVTNDPEYTTKIPFSMQYFETDYQYLKRLAWMYGEKFYFNGNNLVFGKINKEYTTKLTYNKDLIEVKLNSRLIPNKFKQYYHTLQEIQSDAIIDITDSTTFTGISGIQSNQLNQREHYPNVPIATPVYDPDSMTTLTKIRKESTMNQMFVVTGRTNMYKVTIGELLEVDFGDEITVDASVGTLRVTRVLHVFDQNKRYYNEFEACQNIYDYFPYENTEIPIAQTLPATVMNNQDPEGLGRVQLKFDFEKELCQHWFRCATPDGGGNKNIGKEKNRGMIFVPELGDRIFLGFMEGNPDKPFVAGSFFHGNNASKLGGGKGNHVRAISDKANNTIQWNSAAGITITDRVGSTVHLDGSGNITIMCPETLGIHVGKKMQLVDDKGKVKGQAGATLIMNKRGHIELTGSRIVLKAIEEMAMMEDTTIQVDPEWGPKTVYKDGSPISKGEVEITALDWIGALGQNNVNVKSTFIGISADQRTQVDGGGGTIIEENGEVHIN